MSKVSDAVEKILTVNPMARDSDNELLIDFLQASGAELSAHQQHIFRNVSFESITRCRRKLQEEGKFMPSPQVARQRRLKSYIVQQNIPTTKAEKVPELVGNQPKAISWMDEND